MWWYYCVQSCVWLYLVHILLKAIHRFDRSKQHSDGHSCLRIEIRTHWKKETTTLFTQKTAVIKRTSTFLDFFLSQVLDLVHLQCIGIVDKNQVDCSIFWAQNTFDHFFNDIFFQRYKLLFNEPFIPSNKV